MSRVRCPSRFTNVVARARLNISELVLQQEEVVGGGDGDDVFVRVPRRVQDLLVEVEAVDEDLVALALPGRRYLEERNATRSLFNQCNFLWIFHLTINLRHSSFKCSE